MTKRRIISLFTALLLVFSSAVTAFAAESELEESIGFINGHKEMLSLYHSALYDNATAKLSSSDISDEEKQQLTDYIITLRKGLENCLDGEHRYLIDIMDSVGPLDCTTLGLCEYCEHSEIILTGDGYRERHRDSDKDGICDDCKREMPHIGCDHFCHKENFITKKVLLPLFRIIWRFFGIEEYCECGTYHFN